VREETQPPKSPKICVLCKLPITDAQRPSVQLRNGNEVHIQCYAKYEEAARRPN